ncbi:MAG TPA: carboxypeptidase regulatory-like domain-containing protein [Blastocatellia bacterium]|nr:carboxypeptidase regulatory-like domain-containing protein [Blastocatellia bacterium]
MPGKDNPETRDQKSGRRPGSPRPDVPGPADEPVSETQGRVIPTEPAAQYDERQGAVVSSTAEDEAAKKAAAAAAGATTSGGTVASGGGGGFYTGGTGGGGGEPTPQPGTGTITGTVFYLDPADGRQKPLSKETFKPKLFLLRNGRKEQVPLDRILTFTDGKFTISRLAAGDYILASPPEIELGQQQCLRLMIPEMETIALTIEPHCIVSLGQIGYEAEEGFVRGVVYLNEDGTHRPDHNPRLIRVPVTLVHLPDKVEITDYTDDQGIFQFSDLEPGLYLLRIEQTVDGTKFGLEPGMYQLEDDPAPAFYLGSNAQKVQDFAFAVTGGAVRGFVFLDRDATKHRFGNEPPIPGVNVILTDTRGDVVDSAVTDANGGYQLEATPGKYLLKFSRTIGRGLDDAFRKQYGAEQTITTASTIPIEISAGRTVLAPDTGYQPELHGISGRVVFEDGSPVANLVVTLCDETGKEVDTTVTSEQGYYTFNTGRSGDYTVKFPDPPFQGQLLTPKSRAAHVESMLTVPDTRYRLTAGDGGNVAALVTPTSSIQESVSDIASYMPTAQMTWPDGGRGGWGTPGAQAPLGQTVTNALTEVLGRKLKTDDPQALIASLDRSFTPVQVESRIEYKWTPRTYAVMTELGGGLSGAQASIYHRAKAALDDALPLLDGLYPLLPDFDPQETGAVRSIVRKEFEELVDELGIEGGPRTQRVDDLFGILKDQLIRLEQEFGFGDQSQVNTVEEEQNLTNYFVVRDYIFGLEEAWSGAGGFRSQFTGKSKFLGTQLVLLSRALSVVAESVDEVSLTMDSVFLGPSERQTVRINFPAKIKINNHDEDIIPGQPGPPPSMLVSELLGWVERFATEEGPTLVQDGGRIGVNSIQPTAERLQRLVLGAARTSLVSHIGFNRQRVRRSLDELASQLGEVAQLAAGLRLNK